MHDTSGQKGDPAYSLKPEDMRLTFPARQPGKENIRLRTTELPMKK